MTLTAEKILDIPVTEPEKLDHNRKTISTTIKTLIKLWHPDVNKDPKAGDVFHRLIQLRESAEEKLLRDEWDIPGQRMFTYLDGSQQIYHYVQKFQHEMGTGYIGKSTIVYEFTKDFTRFAEFFFQHRKFDFSSDEMKMEFQSLVPQQVRMKSLVHNVLIVVDRPSRVVCLRDLHNHFKSGIQPEHISWITNRLFNIVCYLDRSNIVHGAINLDNIFVDTERHTAHLLGGWQYATTRGGALSVLPTATVSCISPDIRQAKKSSTRIDLACIREVVRILTHNGTNCKPPISRWLKFAAGEKAIQDYLIWDDVLKEAYGARRFVKFPIPMSDIYKEK